MFYCLSRSREMYYLCVFFSLSIKNRWFFHWAIWCMDISNLSFAIVWLTILRWYYGFSLECGYGYCTVHVTNISKYQPILLHQRIYTFPYCLGLSSSFFRTDTVIWPNVTHATKLIHTCPFWCAMRVIWYLSHFSLYWISMPLRFFCIFGFFCATKNRFHPKKQHFYVILRGIAISLGYRTNCWWDFFSCLMHSNATDRCTVQTHNNEHEHG